MNRNSSSRGGRAISRRARGGFRENGEEFRG